MDFNRFNTKKLLSLIAVIAIMVMAITHVADIIKWVRVGLGVLSPFIIGGAIAFVLNVPMRFFEEKVFPRFSKFKGKKIKKLERPLAIFFSFLIVFVTLTLVVSIVIPQIVEAIGLFASNIPGYVNTLTDWSQDFIRTHDWVSNLIPNEWEEYLTDDKKLQSEANKFVDTKKIESFFTTLSTTIGATFGATLGFVSSFLGQLANFFIGLFFAIYILANKEELQKQMNKGLYAFFGRNQAIYAVHVGQVAYSKFYSFITGQMAEAVILGVLCFIGMSLFRFPYAMMISVLIGFANLIPIAGTLIAGAIGSLIIASIDPLKGALFLVFLIILQQFEGNIIYPRVVGGSVGLPALWTLVAITLGGTLMGLIGMLTFVPLGATIYTIFTEIVNTRLYSKGIEEDSSELMTGLPEGIVSYNKKEE